MKYSKSSTGAVLAGLVLIGAAAMYSWIVAPHVDYLRAVQKYEPILDDIAKEKSALQDKLVQRRNMLDKINLQFDDLSRTLFSYEQATELPQSFEAVAEQYGCTVATVDLSDRPISIIGAEGGAKTIDAMEAHLSVVGEYNGLTAFIKRLQEGDHKIWIHSLKMRVLEPHGGQVVCDLTMTIYVMQEKEAPSNG